MSSIDLDLHPSTTTIENKVRSAHVGDDFSVIFCQVYLGGEHAPSHWKACKTYKTHKSAVQAARYWVEFGK